MNSSNVAISSLNVSVFKIPTNFPESDGTLEWDSTTMILVDIVGGDLRGLGYTYGSAAIAHFIEDELKDLVIGKDCFQIEATTSAMIKQIRNNGNCGLAFMAVSAVDIALWDLKAKLLGLPLASLLGRVRNSILIYGSGGFTTYSTDHLKHQFERWKAEGLKYMKMKIGRDPNEDIPRIKAAKDIIGANCSLFVDANGAFTVKQALQMAEEFKKYDVAWYEEPVSSDNLAGLNFIRENSPPGMNISAGEYGYNLPYFAQMIRQGAVDVLQADITRCGGISGFLKVGYLCEAYQIPFSSHCAPSLHLHAALSLPAFYIAEYFHDHVRIENMFFDGVPKPMNGLLFPDLSSTGIGLRLKTADVEKYRIK